MKTSGQQFWDRTKCKFLSTISLERAGSVQSCWRQGRKIWIVDISLIIQKAKFFQVNTHKISKIMIGSLGDVGKYVFKL